VEECVSQEVGPQICNARDTKITQLISGSCVESHSNTNDRSRSYPLLPLLELLQFYHEGKATTPTASWLQRETLNDSVIAIRSRREAKSTKTAAETLSAASLAAALIAKTIAILIAITTRINCTNSSGILRTINAPRRECDMSSKSANIPSEIYQRTNRPNANVSGQSKSNHYLSTSTYDTLRINLPTYGTYEAVSDHIYGTKFWTSHSFMCIVSRISMYYAGLWYKGILCGQKQIHQCFRTTSGPISSLALKFSRFRGSVTKSIFYISALTSFIVRFYIFESQE
jgi:hypothetical protein